MLLDNEQQRALLLELFKHASFPGQFLEIAYLTKKAINDAQTVDEASKATAVLNHSDAISRASDDY